jgi:ferric-dicitrate binding protein FerR (iron transport regulator)
MDDVLTALLFDGAQTPEERLLLRTALEDDPALAEALARWHQLGDSVRASLDAGLPERRLLVMHALEDQGRADLLDSEERQALDAARKQLERALKAHPSLLEVVKNTQAEAAAFEAAWLLHMEAPAPRERAPDRAPAPAAARRSPLRWAWRIGTLAAVLGFVAVLGLLLQRDNSLITVATASGEVEVITLADGSTIRVMGGSILSYPDPEQAASSRRVQLQGRAYFDIVPGQQAFTVETPTALATVLGTRFGIQADESLTEVVLEAGRVALAPQAALDQPVVLDPGQMSQVEHRGMPTPPSPVNVSEALSWTGLFIFRATPMADMVRRLSQHYGVEVSYAPALAVDSVSGTFAPEDGLEDILRIISPSLDAEVRITDEGGFELVPVNRPER